MKQLALCLSLLLLLKPVFPVFDYVINYDYIAGVLCINNDKPELNCNGKCYLMQQLAKNAEHQPQQQQDNTRKIEIPWVFVAQPEIGVPIRLMLAEKPKPSDVTQCYQFTWNTRIWRPPIASLFFFVTTDLHQYLFILFSTALRLEKQFNQT